MLIKEKTRNVSEFARKYGTPTHVIAKKDKKVIARLEGDGYDLHEIYNEHDNTTLGWFWKKRLSF